MAPKPLPEGAKWAKACQPKFARITRSASESSRLASRQLRSVISGGPDRESMAGPALPRVVAHPSPGRLAGVTASIATSQALFDRALVVTPGGVNSPVRAFRGVGGTPRFMARG